MNKWEDNIGRIDEEIKYQEEILELVQRTKAYRIVEGIHYIRRKDENFESRMKQVQASLCHMAGRKDERIVEKDALTAVTSAGHRIKAETEQLKSEIVRMQEESGFLLDNISLLATIKKRKLLGQALFCIMAPLESIDLPDGYARRIKNIDEMLPSGALKIYISKGIDVTYALPICYSYSDNHISIQYDESNNNHCIWVDLLVSLIGSAYIHSVYQSIDIVAENASIVKIYDFHGVVPEELLYMDRNKEAEFYGQREAVLVKNANYIIVANQAMKEHIMRKYAECSSKFIVLPMNNDDNNIAEAKSVLPSKVSGDKPVVIYSGGLQKWQLIPEMQDAMLARKDACDYRIYVSDKKQFLELWGKRDKPGKWTIDTLSPELLIEEYKAAHYGFVIRDDIIVNRVACPTKIIDYIKYGIVPIVKSADIGDFRRKNLQYITINDFMIGNLPSQEKREEMSFCNIKVMQDISGDYLNGRKTLQEIMGSIL